MAIQSLGSVLLDGTLVAAQALKVTFEPVLCDPGSTAVNASAQDYLDLLSATLKDKPKLGVRLGGICAAAERQNNNKGEYTHRSADLLALAQQRANAVRCYMQGQGVGRKQPRNCRPAIDPQADTTPRVDIRV